MLRNTNSTIEVPSGSKDSNASDIQAGESYLAIAILWILNAILRSPDAIHDKVADTVLGLDQFRVVFSSQDTDHAVEKFRGVSVIETRSKITVLTPNKSL